MSRIILLALLGCVLFSCSSVMNRAAPLVLPNTAKVVVLPFENHTETPMAGLRAASMLEGVLRARGYAVKARFWQSGDRDLAPAEIRELLKKARRSGVAYAFTGAVNEFRYKTGIDGEPAVSITMVIYSLEKDEVVWSSTGSATGWSHESLGTIAQKLMDKLVR